MLPRKPSSQRWACTPPTLLWSSSGFIPSECSCRSAFIWENLWSVVIWLPKHDCTPLFFSFFMLCEEQKFFHNLAHAALIPLICSTSSKNMNMCKLLQPKCTNVQLALKRPPGITWCGIISSLLLQHLPSFILSAPLTKRSKSSYWWQPLPILSDALLLLRPARSGEEDWPQRGGCIGGNHVQEGTQDRSEVVTPPRHSISVAFGLIINGFISH